MGENYITVVNPHFQDSTPRLNKVYLLPISTISNEIINEVNTTVIGY